MLHQTHQGQGTVSSLRKATRLVARLKWRRLIWAILSRILPYNAWADRICATLRFRIAHGRSPDLKTSPIRFNDYLFKIKTDGTLLDPLRQFISDKEYVKLYVAMQAGHQYPVKTYGVLHSEDEVDHLQLSQFPCVIKPTHASGPILLQMTPGDRLNRDLLKAWLRYDYYRNSREQNYKHLTPKVIIEEFITDDGKNPAPDYKILCFGGVPQLIQVDLDRHKNRLQHFYDTAWNRLQYSVGFESRPENDPKPPQLEKMLEIAAKLSHPFPFIRVDMYVSGTEVKVGELTNCPYSASRPFSPRSVEFTLGGFLDREG